ncbi:MAG: cytoplasmic protein [Deltaproteobacteria bacterium]|nr:MAG: cytoplasmic protein [Deltaproteobacteria bacterium]
MLKKDLMIKNPLRQLVDESEKILSDGEFGVVLARAGVGKTAFIVQIALSGLLQNKNVLHISLDEPVQKVSLWYEEVFRMISDKYDSATVQNLWETILTHRFIMTFQVDAFSVPKLDERISDLTEQAIFFPQIILIDGLAFADVPTDIISSLRPLARQWGVQVWFTARIHRTEISTEVVGSAQPSGEVLDLFDTAIQLEPEENRVHVRIIKGPKTKTASPDLLLDPSTMLIVDK